MSGPLLFVLLFVHLLWLLVILLVCYFHNCKHCRLYCWCYIKKMFIFVVYDHSLFAWSFNMRFVFTIVTFVDKKGLHTKERIRYPLSKKASRSLFLWCSFTAIWSKVSLKINSIMKSTKLFGILMGISTAFQNSATGPYCANKKN